MSIQKPESTEATQPRIPVQVFQQMDHLDENQILAEMRGELIEEFVYSIQLGGKEVTNLSYAGVKEAIRRRGQVEQLEVRVSEDEKEYHALVRVRDLTNHIDVLGAASAEKDKPFSYTLAANKAERNALAKLIPAKLIAALVQEYLQRNKPKPVGGTSVVDTKKEGTTPPVESPVPAKPSPEPAWTVPRLKDQAPPDFIKKGLRQIALGKDLKSFGMINILGAEISLVPERMIPTNTPLIDGFLIRKVVEPFCKKHNVIFRVEKTENDLLEAVLLKGQIQEQQVKELQSAAQWAFGRALKSEEEKRP